MKPSNLTAHLAIVFCLSLSQGLSAWANPDLTSDEPAASAEEHPTRVVLGKDGGANGGGGCFNGLGNCPIRYSQQSMAFSSDLNLLKFANRVRQVLNRTREYMLALGYQGTLKDFFNTPIDDRSRFLLPRLTDEDGEHRFISEDGLYGLRAGNAPTFGALAEWDKWGNPIITWLRFQVWYPIAVDLDPKNLKLALADVFKGTMAQVFGPGTPETNPYRRRLHEAYKAIFPEDVYPREAPEWLSSQDLVVNQMWEKIFPKH